MKPEYVTYASLAAPGAMFGYYLLYWLKEWIIRYFAWLMWIHPKFGSQEDEWPSDYCGL